MMKLKYLQKWRVYLKSGTSFIVWNFYLIYESRHVSFRIFHGSIILWLLLVQHGINECDLMKFHWIWSCTWLQCKSKRAKQIRREEGQVWNRLQGEGKLKKDQLQSRTEVCHLLRVVEETSVKHLFLWKHHLHRDIAFYKCECGSCYAVIHAIFCKSTSAWSQQFEHKKEDQTKEFQSLVYAAGMGDQTGVHFQTSNKSAKTRRIRGLPRLFYFSLWSTLFGCWKSSTSSRRVPALVSWGVSAALVFLVWCASNNPPSLNGEE
jgi:hypothetical protein